jgi:hypothetical protein
MTHVGNGHMAESVAGSARWRMMMVERFKAATPRHGDFYSIVPSGIPVHASATFYLPGDPVAVRSGDVDKLLRNVLDALSACTDKCGSGCKKHAGIYVDDVQVVSSDIAKKRAETAGPGVDVIVKWLSDCSTAVPCFNCMESGA